MQCIIMENTPIKSTLHDETKKRAMFVDHGGILIISTTLPDGPAT